MMNWLLTHLGAFPVDRKQMGITTVKKAIRILADQQVFAIFPQGTRKEEQEITNMKQGAAYFAIKTNTPILPVYIKGTDKVMPRGQAWILPAKVEIFFGEMIRLEGLSGLDHDQAIKYLTDQIKAEMNRLAKQFS
ncbi:1-acyl-sn-glycerol-3-phosphate acyltransferase [Tepidibacillus fermentans]|uniref:1-acyl-sn-glycerol-3-phosphate acyltransferase n=1 Tax=Tepidibacillus fermentans TaxID=1281767 RepID=A0A4R3KCK3_9BACI|nr:1-acyl-sn-glycerol-3-phosphate acyltransferase [Tepidibacillus fermentans]